MTRDERTVRTALMSYAADRPRLELAVPAHMLWHCCCSLGASPSSSESDRAWWAQVMPYMQAACLEPMADLPPLRWHTCKEMALLITKMAMAELHGRPIMTATMAVLRWIEAMLAHDVLDLVEGTAIDKAIDLLLEQVQAHDDLAADVDKSARKVAVRMHAKLQSLGLYKGADIFADKVAA